MTHSNYVFYGLMHAWLTAVREFQFSRYEALELSAGFTHELKELGFWHYGSFSLGIKSKSSLIARVNFIQYAIPSWANGKYLHG